MARVRIEEADGDDFIVSGRIGDAPSEGGEIFASIALEGTLALMLTKAAAVTRESKTGPYILVERIPHSCASDFKSFCTCLQSFVDTLDVWRRQLNDFTPACAMAEKVAAEQKAEINHALRGGFLMA